MLFGAISAISFLFSGYCGFLSLSDRMQYGSWYPPHWTVGGMFGLDRQALGSFGQTIAGYNAGWLFLVGTLLMLLLALRRR